MSRERLAHLSFRCVVLFALAAAVSGLSSAAGAAQLPMSELAQTNGAYLIDLPTTLRLAGARNLDIKIARERLAEARAQNVSATWQFFPWIAPGFTYRRHDNLVQNVEGKIIDVHKDSYAVGPTITAQLDLGEAIFKKLAARQFVKVAEFGLEAQRQDSVLAAAQTYFDLLKARAAIRVAEEALAISTNYAEQVRQAVHIGVAFKADLLRVQVQAERNQLTLRQGIEQQRTASARLAQTLRLDPTLELVARDDDLVPIHLIQTNVPLSNLVMEAVAARPELKLARAQRDAARETRRAARYGPLIPGIGAQMFAGGLGGGKDGDPSEFGESEDYQVTIGWRIGPGGLFDRGKIRASDARLRIAMLSENKTSDEITKQVVETQARVLSLADQAAVGERAIKAAEETLRLTRERKEFGVGAVLENIQAEQELTRSRLEYYNSVAEYNKAEHALARTLGRFTNEPKDSLAR